MKMQSVLQKTLLLSLTLLLSGTPPVSAIPIKVDIGLREMYRLIQDEVRRDPERIERLTQILSVSRYLERMADLAASIAEDVVYLFEGQIIRHRSEVLPT